jgi:hypothetical protein
MHYFLCSGGPDAVSIKSTMGHIVPNLFFHLVGFAGHIEKSGASGARNVDALFSMVGWARCSFHKKLIRSRYTKHVVLHPMGSTGHVMHSSSSGYEMLMYHFSWSGGPDAVSIKSASGHVTPNLYFCIRWVQVVM